MEERVLHLDRAAAGLGGHARCQPHGLGGHGGRRSRRRRSRRTSSSSPTPSARRRPTARRAAFNNDAVQANAGFDFKYGLTRSLIVDAHLAHRLRAGGGRPAADQPDALQPVLPREARLLHRRPGHFRLRRRAGRQQPGGDCAAAVLQPPDWPEPAARPCRSWAACRLTGRAGAFSVGALNIQTDDKPAAGAVATNFSALRLKRNLPPPQQRRHDGDAARARAGSAGGIDASYSVGADATMLFFKSINLTGYYARTSTPDAHRLRPRPAAAIAARFDYNDDRYGARCRAHADRRATSTRGRLRPAHRRPPQLRPAALQPAAAAQQPWSASTPGRPSLDYVTDAPHDGSETREARGRLPARLPVERSVARRVLARVRAAARAVHRSRRAWSFRPAATHSTTSRASYPLGQQRRVSGRLSAWPTARFYGGDQVRGRLPRPLGRRRRASRWNPA